MSKKFNTLLTEIGAAKLANATALGVPIKITQMAVGDGNGNLPEPNIQQTKLVSEKRRAALNQLYIDPQNDSQIIAEQVIPEDEGGFWIREIGLYDESDALIAVGNCPESYKPVLSEGSGRTQTVRMILNTSGTENITLSIDSSVVLATREYVDNKLIDKQPLDNTLTELSGKNVDQLLEYLGLGTAALRDVGNTGNQIPDMSYFSFNRDGQKGWEISPNGTIRQFGTVTLTPVGNFNAQTLGGVTYYTHYYRINFPRTYPNKQIATVATLASSDWANQSSMSGRSIAIHRDSDDGVSVSKTKFIAAYTTTVLGETPIIHYESTGY